MVGFQRRVKGKKYLHYLRRFELGSLHFNRGLEEISTAECGALLTKIKTYKDYIHLSSVL